MKKILVADDEDVLCELYAEELSSEGYEVITTRDGAALIEMIEQHEPDLIVLDIRLGKYDGLALLQEIRNAYYNMPVILYSAYSSFKYDLKSIAADYYVVKTPDLNGLRHKIKMALEAKPRLFGKDTK
ncbi:MAG: response regulator [Deltaproteobacteria bacterium]|nr:response regulator [Deltaproteobacteria bacterium]MBW2020422.1 response regulator [Deltaproteobacteria bacterium]MBW2075166.1 response regulator [Deltaproteobacteria bacterium]